ncbi:cytochrome c biogenesis protein CcsA [Tepidibacillus sp. LV47]|uniref:cytochrome c biogenesis protein CcsA n=1 Tax=Tepidibacillus sp. LV47 TaxID=3398228 RepID=UPI003AAAA2ED
MSGWIFLVFIFYSFSLGIRMSNLFTTTSRKKHLAEISLFLGGLIQLLLFLITFFKKGYFPLLTIYDVLYFYSLIVIILAMMIQRFFQVDVFEISIIMVGFFLLLLAVIIGETSPTIDEHFLSRFLFLHILLTLTSYGIFSLSALFSLFFLLYEHLLKQKKWNLLTKKMPSLQRLEKNIFLANLFGNVFLFIGLLFGSIWATTFFRFTFFYDPKVMISILVFTMYVVFFIQRQKGNWSSKQLSQWNLLCFMMVLLNFLLSHYFQSFHHWF